MTHDFATCLRCHLRLGGNSGPVDATLRLIGCHVPGLPGMAQTWDEADHQSPLPILRLRDCSLVGTTAAPRAADQHCRLACCMGPKKLHSFIQCLLLALKIHTASYAQMCDVCCHGRADQAATPCFLKFFVFLRLTGFLTDFLPQASHDVCKGLAAKAIFAEHFAGQF